MSDDLCAIHDRISRTPIGVGEQRNEVFVYKSLKMPPLYTCSTKASDSRKLWHIQLGHPSNLVVDKLLGHSSLQASNND